MAAGEEPYFFYNLYTLETEPPPMTPRSSHLLFDRFVEPASPSEPDHSCAGLTGPLEDD